MYSKFNKNNSGFTLIEIIASIAILGMVIAVLLPIFPQIMSWSKISEDQLVTSNLLDQVAHDVKENFASLSENESCSSRVADAIQRNYIYQDGTYYAKIEMSQDDEEKNIGLFRIHIEIHSSDNRGAPLSDTYTYLSCAGDGNE